MTDYWVDPHIAALATSADILSEAMYRVVEELYTESLGAGHKANQARTVLEGMMRRLGKTITDHEAFPYPQWMKDHEADTVEFPVVIAKVSSKWYEKVWGWAQCHVWAWSISYMDI